MNNTFLIKALIICLVCLNPFFSIGQNNTCANATTIEAGTFTIDGFMGTGAIFQSATAAAWYRFNPVVDGVFTVSSCESQADTRLVILLLDDCANPSDFVLINSIEDNCSDGLGGNTASFIEVVAKVGFSYAIYWDDAQSATGFTWSLTFEPEGEVQKGETCATADTIIEGTHQVADLTGTGAAFTDAVSAKWYAYTPRKSGELSISSCESGVNTRLFIWEGSCGAQTILAQANNGCEEGNAFNIAAILVEADEIYYIYWDDHSTKAGFSFTLSMGDTLVGTKEPQWAKNIQIYPNPAANQFFVKYRFPTSTNLSFSISNSIGQIVQSQKWTDFQQGEISVPVTDLPNGIYYLVLQTATEQLTRKLVVKE